MGYGVSRQRGDYGVRMRSRRGDPGFLSTIAGGLVNLIPGGSTILGIGKALLGGGTKQQQSPGGLPVVPVPGIAGMIQRIAPGGKTGLMVGSTGHRGRRMNPANGKALNRAIRRINSFGSLVARSKKSVAKANRLVGNVTHHRAPSKRR